MQNRERELLALCLRAVSRDGHTAIRSCDILAGVNYNVE